MTTGRGRVKGGMGERRKTKEERTRRNSKDFQLAETMIKEGVIIEEYINEQIYSTKEEYIGIMFSKGGGGGITSIIFSLLKQ